MDGVILSNADAAEVQSMVNWWRKYKTGRRDLHRRRPRTSGGGSTALSLYVVDRAADGHGMYYCKPADLNKKARWNIEGFMDMIDIDTTKSEEQVLNLSEQRNFPEWANDGTSWTVGQYCRAGMFDYICVEDNTATSSTNPATTGFDEWDVIIDEWALTAGAVLVTWQVSDYDNNTRRVGLWIEDMNISLSKRVSYIESLGNLPSYVTPLVSNIHIAYVKTAPALNEGDEVTCYLDTDTTGQEVTVYCNIIGDGGSEDLQDCIPELADGQPMPVWFDIFNNKWRSLWWFNLTSTCS